MPGVGDPGIGSTISGVTLGEGVMLGMRTGVGIVGSSGNPSVGVGGAPHSPEFLEQAVNRAAMMAIWAKRWSFCISRRGLYQQQAEVTFKMTDLLGQSHLKNKAYYLPAPVRAEALPQFIKAPPGLSSTSPKGFHVLRQGFIPPNCAK
jgi:hypothetical protein